MSIDHYVNHAIRDVGSAFSSLTGTALREALDHLLLKQKDIKIEIDSPESTTKLDVQRAEGLLELGVERDVITDYIQNTTSAMESNDQFEYSELVVSQAERLINKKNGAVVNKSQVQKIVPLIEAEKEMEL
jgi:hypothetical protein